MTVFCDSAAPFVEFCSLRERITDRPNIIRKLLNFLAEKDILATFYTVGSRVLEFPLTLQQEYMAGHEISVHTWSHPVSNISILITPLVTN